MEVAVKDFDMDLVSIGIMSVVFLKAMELNFRFLFSHLSLFSPFLNVSNCFIYMCSLAFKMYGSLSLTFSKIRPLRWLTL